MKLYTMDFSSLARCRCRGYKTSLPKGGFSGLLCSALHISVEYSKTYKARMTGSEGMCYQRQCRVKAWENLRNKIPSLISKLQSPPTISSSERKTNLKREHLSFEVLTIFFKVLRKCDFHNLFCNYLKIKEWHHKKKMQNQDLCLIYSEIMKINSVTMKRMGTSVSELENPVKRTKPKLWFF